MDRCPNGLIEASHLERTSIDCETPREGGSNGNVDQVSGIYANASTGSGGTRSGVRSRTLLCLSLDIASLLFHAKASFRYRRSVSSNTFLFCYVYEYMVNSGVSGSPALFQYLLGVDSVHLWGEFFSGGAFNLELDFSMHVMQLVSGILSVLAVLGLQQVA